MRVLLLHSFYQQPGGEDRSFLDEAALLESRGHEVVRYTAHNHALEHMAACRVATKLVWNRQSYAEVRALIRSCRPEVMHSTNTFPLVSPSVYYAARHERVPVVQSLHNYRLLCPNALLLRDNKVCERCLGKALPWSAVVHGCYRESRLATSAVAAMIGWHRVLGTWSRVIDLYLALTEFARAKFIAGGLPRDKIVVKPNFVDEDSSEEVWPPTETSPGVCESMDAASGFALFVGRLSPEKGIDTLLHAWRLLPGSIRLRVVGDGPLSRRVAQAEQEDHRITWLGQLAKADVNRLIRAAAVVIVPSICYETFGRVIVEAFAQGVPVIASRLGAMAELVEEGRTGLLFEPANPQALAVAVTQMLADDERLARMRAAARQEYLLRYTAEQNYRFLLAAYERAIQSRRSEQQPQGERQRQPSTAAAAPL